MTADVKSTDRISLKVTLEAQVQHYTLYVATETAWGGWLATGASLPVSRGRTRSQQDDQTLIMHISKTFVIV